jgi:hypothetical protein
MWDSRVTASNPINNIKDVIEHVCRLQNWSEVGSVVDFGKEYSAGALINTASLDFLYSTLSGTFQAGEQISNAGGSTAYVQRDNATDKMSVNRYVPFTGAPFEVGDTITGGTSSATAVIVRVTRAAGGFDNPYNATASAASEPLSFQIEEESKMQTDIIKRDACKSAWYASYVNEGGYECLEPLLSDYTTSYSGLAVTDIITLSTLPYGVDWGTVREPDPKNVYCEPYIRYGYNGGSKKFDNILKITNVHKSTYSSSYTEGFASSTKAEQLWNRCNSELWGKFRTKEAPPSDITDQKMIGTYNHALFFLENWITWMTRRRINIILPYSYVYGSGTAPRDWHIGRHVYLNLPHQTDGSNLECVITSIRKDRYRGCTCEFIFLDDIEVIAEIQNVMYTESEGADADWVDTTTEYGDSNDKINTLR